MANQPVEGFIRDLAPSSKLRIAVSAAYRYETPIPPEKIRADNHACPVELEPLSCVNTTHLPESALFRGPER